MRTRIFATRHEATNRRHLQLRVCLRGEGAGLLCRGNSHHREREKSGAGEHVGRERERVWRAGRWSSLRLASRPFIRAATLRRGVNGARAGGCHGKGSGRAARGACGTEERTKAAAPGHVSGGGTQAIRRGTGGAEPATSRARLGGFLSAGRERRRLAWKRGLRILRARINVGDEPLGCSGTRLMTQRRRIDGRRDH
jgi:hypothetical protein